MPGACECTYRVCRQHVPVGLVTPGGRLAGDLAFDRDEGVGLHWQATLDAAAFTVHQLPDPVGSVAKPSGW